MIFQPQKPTAHRNDQYRNQLFLLRMVAINSMQSTIFEFFRSCRFILENNIKFCHSSNKKLWTVTFYWKLHLVGYLTAYNAGWLLFYKVLVCYILCKPGKSAFRFRGNCNPRLLSDLLNPNHRIVNFRN